MKSGWSWKATLGLTNAERSVPCRPIRLPPDTKVDREEEALVVGDKKVLWDKPRSNYVLGRVHIAYHGTSRCGFSCLFPLFPTNLHAFFSMRRQCDAC